MRTSNDVELAEAEIYQEQKIVDFDTREFTIEYIVAKYLKGIDTDENDIYVPDYQREFVWDNIRQSKLIESLILGLPIPLIFLAENKDKDNRLEIVDGSQRIRTLTAFMHDELELKGLEKLKKLNGFKYSDLSSSRQRKFKNTPLRMIVLSDKANEDIRNEIFERINRGSDLLQAMEKRKGIYRGAFGDFIYEICAKDPLFNKLTKVNKRQAKRQEKEELILRFFALSERYNRYPKRKGVAKFLDEYLKEKNMEFRNLEYQNIKELAQKIETSPKLKQHYTDFTNMLESVNKYFEFGFCKSSLAQVSRVYFEAVSVGTLLALQKNSKFNTTKASVNSWLQSSDFKRMISGKYHTHTPGRIKQRVEFVRNKLLNS